MWEYEFLCFDLITEDGVTIDENERNMVAKLDELGRQDWELVSVVQNKNSGLQFLFWFKKYTTEPVWKEID